MKRKTLVAIYLFFLLLENLSAEYNLPLHLKIMTTDKASGPEIWQDRLFLTARPEKASRLVGAAFDFEDYRIIHPFDLNEKGIYVYSAPLPDRDSISYRLIIDGLWTTDPLCTDNEKDAMGIKVSTVKITAERPVRVTGPEMVDGGKTRFSIRSKPDSTVSIVGTFNGWDPYMSPMMETSEGVYSADLKLRDGSYFYYFIIDGKKAMDPQNFARARNVEGEEVCRIDIKRT